MAKLTAHVVHAQQADRREVLQRGAAGGALAGGRPPEQGGPVLAAGLRGARRAHAVHRGRLPRPGRRRLRPRDGHGHGTYKACYAAGCSDVDVLAAVLAAVADGVHVLSLSLGADEASDYLSDPIAIGTFFAVQSGVAVVCSAGNSGPRPGTVTNVAPWMFTVGASTMDRDFPAYVTFGGSLTIEVICSITTKKKS